jgi:hypothetical protein
MTGGGELARDGKRSPATVEVEDVLAKEGNPSSGRTRTMVCCGGRRGSTPIGQQRIR